MAWEIGSLFLIIAAVAAMIYGGITLTLNQMNKRFDELKDAIRASEARLIAELRGQNPELKADIKTVEIRLRDDIDDIKIVETQLKDVGEYVLDVHLKVSYLEGFAQVPRIERIREPRQDQPE